MVFFAQTASARADAPPLRRTDPDPWWGSDKALHLSLSAGIAATGYAAGTALFSDRWKALTLGGGAAIGLGAAKEGWDALGHGDPSWKDFTWDVIGTVAGLAVAYAVDWAVGGRGAPALTAGAQPAALVVRF